MRKAILFFSAVLFSSLVSAEWSGMGNVVSVYSHNGKHIVETTIDISACNTEVKGKFWWPADDSDAKDMYSLALAALMSSKAVRFAYSSSDLQCTHDAILATHANIRN